jgi:hypothetical protein
MSYQSQADLTLDAAFNGRATSAATEQAAAFVNDQRPDWVATARAVLRGESEILGAFVRLDAAGPGIADKVDPEGDGSIDQSLVADADLLALTQGNWPVVAGLYFDADGSPLAEL